MEVKTSLLELDKKLNQLSRKVENVVPSSSSSEEKEPAQALLKKVQENKETTIRGAIQGLYDLCLGKIYSLHLEGAPAKLISFVLQFIDVVEDYATEILGIPFKGPLKLEFALNILTRFLGDLFDVETLTMLVNDSVDLVLHREIDNQKEVLKGMTFDIRSEGGKEIKKKNRLLSLSYRWKIEKERHFRIRLG